MSKREDYEAKTEALLGPIAEANGVSIYDVEYVKEGSDYYLRAFIDKPQGVNIKDCENVSRALSDALDREDFIPDSYILEEIRLFKPVDKCREFSGELRSFDGDSVTILQEEGPRSFRRSDIALIRLAFDF